MGSKQSKFPSDSEVRNVDNKSVYMRFNKDHISESNYQQDDTSEVLFTGQTEYVFGYLEKKNKLSNGSIRLSNGLIISGDFSKERIYFHDLTYEYKDGGDMRVEYQSGLCDDISLYGGVAFIYVKKNGYVYKCYKVVNSHPVGKYIMFDRDGGVFTNNGHSDNCGEYKKLNGDVYKGQFNNKYKLHGKGEVIYVYDNVYSGEFFNGKLRNGVHTDGAGNKYEGKFSNSEYDVYLLYGKITKLNGEIIVGDFNRMGRPNGRCVIKYNNKLMEDGEYVNGEMVNGLKYKYAIDGTVCVCNEKGETLSIFKGDDENNGKCANGEGEEKSTTSIIPNAPEGFEDVVNVKSTIKKNSGEGSDSEEENVNIPPGGVPVEC